MFKPWVYIPNLSILYQQRPKLFSWARGKYIWIGFIIGVIVFVPTVIVADWFPDLAVSRNLASLPNPIQPWRMVEHCSRRLKGVGAC